MRLTLWYVGLLAVILAVFGAGVYLSVRTTLHRNLDDSIETRANTVLAGIVFEGGQPVLPPTPSSSDDDEFVRVVDIGSPPVETDPEIRVRRFPIIRDGETVGLLEVGQSREHVTEALSTLLLTLGLAYPLALLVAVLGGIFLAGRALAPVDSITDMARRVSAEDLGQRLDLRLPDDELGRLARTFNEMIGRLDDAFQRQRRFTADASHELRTPLTVMKGQVEVALQRERSPDDYRQVLRAVNEEVDRLIGLAGSLLTLARAEAGQIPLNLERIDVAELMSGAVEQVTPAATANGLSIDVVPKASVSVTADEGLVLQLLLNLLDNDQVHIRWRPDHRRLEHDALWSGALGTRHRHRHLGRASRPRDRPLLSGGRCQEPRRGWIRARPGDQPMDRRGSRRLAAYRECRRRRLDLHCHAASRSSLIFHLGFIQPSCPWPNLESCQANMKGVGT